LRARSSGKNPRHIAARWGRRLRGRTYRHPSAAALPAWYSQHFAGYYSEFNPGYADVQRVAELWEYPFGANVSYRIEALERIGYFNLSMGRVGKNTSGGEELDAEYRIAQAGYAIYTAARPRGTYNNARPFELAAHSEFGARRRKEWAYTSLS